ncbi:MAG: efflux RND transporter periplasmic adaptor subunit [Acidobacteria bacterium]|nr:efflux RND transporter periplasmic adaptor subunit [Acidobacteriota bacterium]
MRACAPRLLTVVWLVMVLSACNASSPGPAPASAEPAQPVATAAPAREAEVVASGPLVVENQVDVATQREGVVARILLDVGTSARKGQLLALLDDRQVSADLEAAMAKVRSTDADTKNWEAEVKVAQADLERAQKMWEAQLITKEQLEHAQYRVVSSQYDVERLRETLNNARSVHRSLELELEKTRILAPFDGIVARRYVRPGQKVAVGDRLFWVTALSPLRVRFALPEKFLVRIRKGQELTLISPSMEGEKRAAKVIQLSPVVDPSSGTFEVLAEVVGPAGDLRPGMQVNIHFGKPE